MLYDIFQKFIGKLASLPHVAFVFLGCGFARAWLGWILDFVCNGSAMPSFSAEQAHLLFDLGEIVGFFLLAFLCRKGRPCYRRSWVLAAAPLLTLLVGAASAVAYAAPGPGNWLAPFVVLGGLGYACTLMLWLEVLGCLNVRHMLVAWSASYLLGCGLWLVWSQMNTGASGYACTLMLWLEVLGCLNVRHMLVAWSASYLLGCGLWLVWSQMNTGASTALMGLLPIAVFAMLLCALRKLPDERLPRPCTTPPTIPWKYVAAITAFVLAFAIGDAVSDRLVYSPLSRIGMALTELLVLGGTMFSSGRLDLKGVLTILPFTMAAGLLLTFFADAVGSGSLAQVLLTMSSEMCLVLSYTVGCALAYRLRCSAVFICGIFAGLNKLVLQTGKMGAIAVLDATQGSLAVVTVLGVVAVLVTVGATVVLVQDHGLVERLSWNWQKIQPRNMDCMQVIEAYRLTPREGNVLLMLVRGLSTAENVLLMLVRGLSTAEIAEETFCAPSTVRAHASNVYKKLGVHSRAELAAQFPQLSSDTAQPNP